MAKKIFVSYKYGDREVYPLSSGRSLGTTARHYVDEIASHLDIHDHIYKGENDNESLAGFKDATIASKLRDKIFDTSVTIILISKNMKDPSLVEDDQWIPWEVSYSLKEMTRDGRTSRTNAVLAVVLPDRSGGYDYFVTNICASGCQSWLTSNTFGIIGKNMFNRKQANLYTCPSHAGGQVHSGNDHSYIYPVKWRDFVSDVNGYISRAVQLSENLDDYELAKAI